MQFEFSGNSIDKISADASVIFAYQTDKSPYIFANFKSFNPAIQKNIIKAIQTAKYYAKRGEILNFYLGEDSLSKSIVILGLGKKNEFVSDTLRRSMGILANALKNKIDSLTLEIPSSEINLSADLSAQVLAEGLMLGSYKFEKYKSDKDKNKLSTVIISGKESLQIKNGIQRAKLFSDATILARDLVNEQSAIATPSYLADFAMQITKKDPKQLTCKILDRKQAEKLGMNAFLGVARASNLVEPKFIHLEYKPAQSKNSNVKIQNSGARKLAIVGKGITFDSGGINVKTGNHMQDMKMDMAGAAIVLGVFSVISEIKPKFGVIGLIAATPNLISASSLVPGDVVKALNGKTIEILDTDAEGRVTMADSLSYAVKEGATEVIDFATLTGAVMGALGTEITGLFSNNKDLSNQIQKAATEAGENMWELPLVKDYKEINKSEVADIANIPSTRYGGAITAALFLEEFVSNLPWAHMDIAGPAFMSKIHDIGPKGGTGHGVRTVLHLLS